MEDSSFSVGRPLKAFQENLAGFQQSGVLTSQLICFTSFLPFFDVLFHVEKVGKSPPPQKKKKKRKKFTFQSMWKVSVKGSKTFNHFHPFGERAGGERPWWKLNRRMSRCTCQCLSKIADWNILTFLQIWQGGYISILLNFSKTLRI